MRTKKSSPLSMLSTKSPENKPLEVSKAEKKLHKLNEESKQLLIKRTALKRELDPLKRTWKELSQGVGKMSSKEKR